MSSISDKIIKNTFFNTVGNFSVTFLHLLLIPYIMLKLGPDRFGIWALVSVIFGIFTAFDFGGASSLVKFFSEYEAKKDKQAFNQILFSGFLMMSSFSGVLLVLFLMVVGKLLSFFNIPEQLFGEARFVFLGAAIFFAFNNTFGVFQAVIKGLQRMEIINFINVIGSLFYALGIIVFLELGYGLKGMIVVQGTKIVLINLASIFYAKRLNKHLTFNLSSLRIEQFKKIFHYGIRMQVSNIANLVDLQSDKTIIGYFFGLGYLAFYEIGQKLSLFCCMLVGVFLSALVPAVSELDSAGRKDAIYKLYEKGSKYLGAIMLPLTIFIIVFANLFIYVWMGRGYENSILVVRLLVLGILVNTLTGVGVMIVRGIGKPIYETRYALISLILNIILSILLVRPFGFFGVVIATPVSAIIGSLYFIVSFHHLYSIPLLGFAKKIYIKPFFFSTSLAVVIYYFNTLATKSTMLETRVGFLTLLVIDAILFFVPFVFLLNKSQFWDVEDEVMLVEKARPYPIIYKIVSMLV